MIWHLREKDLDASNFSRELVGESYDGILASVIVVDAQPGQGPRLHKHAYAELFFVIDNRVERRVMETWQEMR